MSSQDRLENVLRDIHVMISKSEVYDTDRIIVSKQDMFNLIDRLNASIYEIMDEYELTQQSRETSGMFSINTVSSVIIAAARIASAAFFAPPISTSPTNGLPPLIANCSMVYPLLYCPGKKSGCHLLYIIITARRKTLPLFHILPFIPPQQTMQSTSPLQHLFSLGIKS